jgi:hypothetical protein
MKLMARTRLRHAIPPLLLTGLAAGALAPAACGGGDEADAA